MSSDFFVVNPNSFVEGIYPNANVVYLLSEIRPPLIFSLQVY